MNITESFVLKNDVVLIPCAELRDDVRNRITYEEGDFTVSRTHGRMASQVIDSETAALLKLFATPRTIVDAVLENSRMLQKDPESWLEELVPYLGTFLQNRVLVPAGADEEQTIEPLLTGGARFADWEVVQCVSLVEDSEIHRLRNGSAEAALKIARGTMPFEGSLWGNEAMILQQLDGALGPRLLGHGTHEGRPYLILDWIDGVECGVAAAQRRHDRAATIELCAAIAAAYAKLHARNVIHSDVHPRNVLVRADGSIELLDFGLSRHADEPVRIGRGGMYYFYEPEFLAGLRTHRTVPSSFAGEQYALAALLYLLVSGSHYLDFKFDRDEMARQAEHDEPLPFAARGVPPWPEVEEILLRALEKDPSKRFPTVGEMASRLAAASDGARAEALSAPLGEEAARLLDHLVEDFSRGGAMYTERYPIAPTASINYGAAGAAAGLLRIASVRGDAALLAVADVWKSRALALIGTGDEAWYNEAADLPKETLGNVTPYHTEAGAWAAAAMIAHARGDLNGHGAALTAFLRASNRDCANLDLTLGRSGTLLASSMLLDLGTDFGDLTAELRRFGNRIVQSIWTELDAMPPIAQGTQEKYLGIAHGWSGFLYATLRWCAASGAPLPLSLATRARELAALGVAQGRGMRWPRQAGGHAHDVMSGWCNGAAGHVFLWTLAHRLLGDSEYRELAELAAWSSWDEPRYTADLCCGTAGRAYALLNLYKHTGATEWLSRARQLANHAAAAAVTTSQRKNALWKGELGVAVLIADLSAPEHAAMPFFEA
ncbi:MAG TPA: lanthionine synthetase LanC family protein [Thermoanaerobaculia bacterium]|nr:lanthionine synthetase LanC family protein [Thermoanaerobaculia bacterium]